MVALIDRSADLEQQTWVASSIILVISVSGIFVRVSVCIHESDLHGRGMAGTIHARTGAC
jgi:hypothetical protein